MSNALNYAHEEETLAPALSVGFCKYLIFLQLIQVSSEILLFGKVRVHVDLTSQYQKHLE